MALRVTYLNISPKVTQKPWCVMSPSSAEGDISLQGFPFTEGLIFWYSCPRKHVIYAM